MDKEAERKEAAADARLKLPQEELTTWPVDDELRKKGQKFPNTPSAPEKTKKKEKNYLTLCAVET